MSCCACIIGIGFDDLQMAMAICPPDVYLCVGQAGPISVPNYFMYGRWQEEEGPGYDQLAAVGGLSVRCDLGPCVPSKGHPRQTHSRSLGLGFSNVTLTILKLFLFGMRNRLFGPYLAATSVSV
jgi:hypothetical protein